MARSVQFSIPYPATAKGRKEWSRWYGLNAIYAGKHWSARKKDSDYWHWLVVAELQRQNIDLRLFQRPVRITFRWNDNLDIDNHAYMGKLIVDGLKGRLLADDNRRCYAAVTHEFHDGEDICVRIEET